MIYKILSLRRKIILKLGSGVQYYPKMVVKVINDIESEWKVPFTDHGVMADWTGCKGLSSTEAAEKIVGLASKFGYGRFVTQVFEFFLQ